MNYIASCVFRALSRPSQLQGHTFADYCGKQKEGEHCRLLRMAIEISDCHGYNAIMELLIRSNDFASSLFGSLLLQAAKYGRLNCLRLLLDHGACIVTHAEFGCNALHFAVLAGSFECVRSLLRHPNARNKFRLHDTDWKGNTALHFAASSGNIKVMALIIDHVMGDNDKGKVFLRKNESGRAAWELALVKTPELAPFILKATMICHHDYPYHTEVLHIPERDLPEANALYSFLDEGLLGGLQVG